MKISNETKVGVVAAISIVLLILGYSYIRGVRIIGKGAQYAATFNDISGLEADDDVMMNGMEVGRITSTDRISDRPVVIEVWFEIGDNSLRLPLDSEIRITTDLLGSVGMELLLGDSNVYAEHGHVFKGTYVPGIQERLEDALDPLVASVNRLVNKIDSVVTEVEMIFDPDLGIGIQEQMNNVSAIIADIQSFARTLAKQNEPIDSIISNLQSITSVLEASKNDITATFANLHAISDTLSQGDWARLRDDLKRTIHEIAEVSAKFTDPNNSIGKMFTDKELYNELVATLKQLSELADSWSKSIEVNIRLGGGRKKSEAPPDTL